MIEDELRTALRLWDLPDSVDLVPVAGGINASAWRIETGRATFFAKRAHASNIHAGLEVADFLSRRGFRSGAPIRTRAGRLSVPLAPEDELAVLTFVPGRPLGASPDDLVLRGRALGRVHRLLQGFDAVSIERRWPWSWLIDFGRLPVGARLRATIADAVTVAEDVVRTERLTLGVVHGDAAGPDFLLQEATGELGLVDWGAVMYGPLIYDVATVCALRRLQAPERTGFLGAYVSASLMPARELGHLETFERLRWVVQARYFGWRLARRIRTGTESDHANRRGFVEALRALRL